MKIKILLYVLIISIIACKKEDDIVLSQTPLIHFTFDGNFANIENPSNNGQQFGGVTFVEDRNGNPESAVSFDGEDDRIKFENPLREGAVAFSISAWYKIGPELSNNFNGNQVVVLRGGTVTNLRISKVDSITSNICFDNFFSGDWLMTCRETFTGDWFHIVGVYERNGSTRFFVNGILVVDNTEIPRFEVSSDYRLESYLGAFISGGVPNQVTTFWNGDMDDFQLFERALSDAEVLDLFNGIPLEVDDSL